ncbi:MAG: glycosyltransferase family 2 protein [Stellaceae bacterium]
MGVTDQPLFSVVIPTRNRSLTFGVALQSVLEQRFDAFEVIVVDDGSSAPHQHRYQDLVEAAPGVARMLTLVPTEFGHGPSYSRNYGVAHSRGSYLCFLDDDDQWTDLEHLGRVARVIDERTAPIDVIFANQKAFRGGIPAADVSWIEGVEKRSRGGPDAVGAYTVTAAELLGCPAHCHLNTTIVSRTLYLEIAGLDEALRYEEDVDFFLRAIDRAKLIKFLPVTISRHNIPDPAAKASMSTSETELSKRLYQLRVLDKAVLFSKRSELRRYAMQRRAYTLKHIAMEAARSHHLDSAAYYARQGLAAGPTLGWLAITASLAIRHRLSLAAPTRIDQAHAS